MSHRADVLIVGGGVVGLTASLAMAKQGFTVAVIDAGSLQLGLESSNIRVYALNQASQDLLMQLNVWSRLKPISCSHYERMYVWDAQNGASIAFDSRQIGASNLGFIIEEKRLKQALLEEIAQCTNIVLFPECIINDIKQAELGIQLHSPDDVWEGQLCMIADGANSIMRQKLALDLTTWSYHQYAIVATVTTEKPHQKTAFQVFNPEGPLALLPLTVENECSIVWSTNSAHSMAMISLDEATFNKAITQAFAGRLGKIQLVSVRHQFPLQMRHVKKYSGKRWMLLGDAAHTIHPLAGLGLNIGLADVRSWMTCVSGMKQPHFSKKQLSAYQRERKHALWQIILLMEGFKTLFGLTFGPAVFMRGIGLNICNSLPPLKRLFIQHAAGISRSE
ncbi:MAG: FAD-dependent monooxygenase [Legionella sp.]|nr:FAD-dependent monooxygenase [Legionella sp.]